MSTSALSAILPLAREGWRLFPLGTRAKTPAVGDWPTVATTDESRLKEWERDFPGCNWALATGTASAKFVLDLDGAAGAAWLDEQIRIHGDAWTQTRQAKTARGQHLYFDWPDGDQDIRNSAGKIATGVDVRAEGGYVCIPPSLHPDGTVYEWLNPGQNAIPAPTWLLALATSKKTNALPALDDVPGLIPEGQRNAVLTSIAGAARRRGTSREGIEALLLAENRQRCCPPLAADEVKAIAASITRYEPEPAASFDMLTQVTLAEILVSREPNVRFCKRLGRWFVWNGSSWREDEVGAIYNRIRELTGELRGQFPEGRMARESARTFSSVEQIAGAHPHYAITIGELDTHTGLLNTPDGTIDRNTGIMRTSRPEDYLTKITSTSPSGDCPLWRSFLKKVTVGDQALEDYLQRLAFYCLWGTVEHDAIFYFYGSGANGKSTFIVNLAHALGDYAVSAPAALFMRNAHEQHPTGLAKLRGARLVYTSEIPDGSWNEEFLKSISGGGQISARFMRGDFFDFEPTFKLLLAGNTKPQLRSVDPAMRRRFNLIPFTASLSAEEVDRELRDRKLPQERAGILAWALAGREEFLRQGLNPPNVVRAATEEYLLEEDRFARWFADCCVLDANRREVTAELYRSFVTWAEAEGETYIPKKNWLGRELKKRGFAQTNDGRTRCWRGLELKTDKASY